MTSCNNRISVKLILTVLIIFVLVVPADSREETWQKLNAEVLRLSQQGKYNDAVFVAKNAVKVAEKSFGANHPRVATSMNNLATLYRIIGR